LINTLYLPELREMLAEKNHEGLAEFCIALHPARTADYMQGLECDEIWEVLRHAEPTLRKEIFSFIDHDRQVMMIETQDRDEVAELVADLAPDDRVDMLEDVDEQVVHNLLPMLPTDERRDILRLQSYSEAEDTAGAILTTEVAKVPETMTVSEALNELARQAEDLETIYYLYVVDDQDHLRGVVSARQLLSKLGKPNTPISELMDTDVVSVRVGEDQEDVAKRVAHFDLLAIPVVDEQHRLVGIITHDDIIDVVREEATEDAHMIAAMAPLEDSYLKTRLLTFGWKRGLWLTILFLTGALTALALRHYEDVQKQFIWLGYFVPLIISSGGNSGSQTATLVITAMAVGDIRLKDWAQVVWRELLVGLMLGGFLGVIGFFAAWSILGDAKKALILPLTLLLVVVCGTLCGSILPLTFRRLGLDPALMSNPFVAAIIDVVGIVIYMSLAIAILT
jgi:magnesium transporter